MLYNKKITNGNLLSIYSVKKLILEQNIKGSVRNK